MSTFFTLKVIRNIINILQRGQTGGLRSISFYGWQCFQKCRSTLQIVTFFIAVGY